MPLSPAIATLLDKVAVDNGFDQELPCAGDWLGFASTQTPFPLRLSTFGDAVCIASCSQLQVARAVEQGNPMASPLSPGAVARRMEPHRLRALIEEDVGRYPDSSLGEIRKRIGPELHQKAVSRMLRALVAEGRLTDSGKGRWTRYRLPAPRGRDG